MTQTGQISEAGGLQPPLQIRRDGLDPTPELGEVRASTGLRTVLSVFGVPVHLVTRYNDVKAVLSDHERFSNSRPAGFVMPGAPPVSADEAADPRAGNLLGLDPARASAAAPDAHRRIHRPADDPASAEDRRDREKAARRNGKTGAPTDFVSTFALPIPSLVICELLGVPYDDREAFQRRSDRQLDLSLPFAERYELQRDSHDYMRSLVKQARSHPDDDMLGMLVREHGDKLTDQELTGICGLLLLAGHETTSNMLGLGTLALLRHPDQLAAVRDDPTRSVRQSRNCCATSILTTPYRGSRPRTSEICGVSIPAGELVLASLWGRRPRPCLPRRPGCPGHPSRRGEPCRVWPRRSPLPRRAAGPDGDADRAPRTVSPVPAPGAGRGFRDGEIPLVPPHLRAAVASGPLVTVRAAVALVVVVEVDHPGWDRHQRADHQHPDREGQGDPHADIAATIPRPDREIVSHQHCTASAASSPLAATSWWRASAEHRTLRLTRLTLTK